MRQTEQGAELNLEENSDEIDRLFARRNYLTPAFSSARLSATMRQLQTQPITPRPLWSKPIGLVWGFMVVGLAFGLFFFNLMLNNPVSYLTTQTAVTPAALTDSAAQPVASFSAITPVPAANFATAAPVASLAVEKAPNLASNSGKSNFQILLNSPQPHTLPPNR